MQVRVGIADGRQGTWAKTALLEGVWGHVSIERTLRKAPDAATVELLNPGLAISKGEWCGVWVDEQQVLLGEVVKVEEGYDGADKRVTLTVSEGHLVYRQGVVAMTVPAGPLRSAIEAVCDEVGWDLGYVPDALRSTRLKSPTALIGRVRAVLDQLLPSGYVWHVIGTTLHVLGPDDRRDVALDLDQPDVPFVTRPSRDPGGTLSVELILAPEVAPGVGVVWQGHTYRVVKVTHDFDLTLASAKTTLEAK